MAFDTHGNEDSRLERLPNYGALDRPTACGIARVHRVITKGLGVRGLRRPAAGALPPPPPPVYVRARRMEGPDLYASSLHRPDRWMDFF